MCCFCVFSLFSLFPVMLHLNTIVLVMVFKHSLGQCLICTMLNSDMFSFMFLLGFCLYYMFCGSTKGNPIELANSLLSWK